MTDPLLGSDLKPITDPKLLELLVCPLTKSRLEYNAQRQELVSRAAGLVFPIVNGVPLLIEDAARAIGDDTEKSGQR